MANYIDIKTISPAVTTVANMTALIALTGRISGDQAFVTATNKLFLYNGSGWYLIATVENSSPSAITGVEGTYALATDGTATTITAVSTDPEGFPLTWSYAVTTGSLTNGGGASATVSQADNVFTITPTTNTAYAGTFSITFSATDGITSAVSAVSAFTLVFAADWSSATQQAALQSTGIAANDYFGRDVSISSDGNTLIVGSTGQDTGATDTGSAYIFTRSGTSWTQQAELTASDAQASDNFGHSVAISGDGDVAIAGAPYEDTGGNVAGAAYIFTRSGTTWTQQAKIQASDKASPDIFGWSVDICTDGDKVIVGAYQEDFKGAAYVFTRSGTTWTQQQKLVASDAASGENFGSGVALDKDGDTAIVGARYESTGSFSANGAAYIFTRSGTTWTQQQKLSASDSASNFNFADSVDISDDGNTIIAGATGGSSSGTSNTGAAYVFTRSGTTWTQQQKLNASNAGSADRFGHVVAIAENGNIAIVGAYQEDTGGLNTGAAYIFTRDGTTWTEDKIALPSGTRNTSDHYGRSVDISFDTAVASSYELTTSDTGAAYIFTA